MKFMKVVPCYYIHHGYVAMMSRDLIQALIDSKDSKLIGSFNRRRHCLGSGDKALERSRILAVPNMGSALASVAGHNAENIKDSGSGNITEFISGFTSDPSLQYDKYPKPPKLLLTARNQSTPHYIQPLAKKDPAARTRLRGMRGQSGMACFSSPIPWREQLYHEVRRLKVNHLSSIRLSTSRGSLLGCCSLSIHSNTSCVVLLAATKIQHYAATNIRSSSATRLERLVELARGLQP